MDGLHAPRLEEVGGEERYYQEGDEDEEGPRGEGLFLRGVGFWGSRLAYWSLIYGRVEVSVPSASSSSDCRSKGVLAFQSRERCVGGGGGGE